MQLSQLFRLQVVHVNTPFATIFFALVQKFTNFYPLKLKEHHYRWSQLRFSFEVWQTYCVGSLKDQIQNDLTSAIRAKDQLIAGTLRMVLAAITNEEVSGKEAKTLTDQELITVLNREAKKRKEAATAYIDAKRQDLADKEEAELKVIQAYLPEALSEDQLAKIISDAVAQVKAAGQSGPSAMGAVMKLVTPQVTGRADGGQVAAAVKNALAN